MPDWTRIIQLRVFSETDDAFRGPRWAFYVFVGAAIIGYISGGVAVAAFLGAVPQADRQAWGVFIGAFALMCGIGWHFGMRGRAKNGLLLALLMSALLLAL